MSKRLIGGFFLVSFLAAALAEAWSAPFDWPQWQGAERTGVSKETGLLKQWPNNGLTLVWKNDKLGGGYGTPAVADGKIYGMSYRGGDEGVWCLDEKSGKELWFTKIAAKGSAGYNEGPRCTPTVDGGLLYVVGVSGTVACLDTKGKSVWQKSMQKDFGGKMMSGWGYSESPLIDGERVVVTPGGAKNSIVALNKKNGAAIQGFSCQVAGGDGAGYSSVIVADFPGLRQYVQFMGKGVVGVNAADGKFLWRYDKVANGTANITTPVYTDGMVFASSGYNTGGGLVKLAKDGNGVKAEEVYFTKGDMQNHHGGMILIGGYLYGNNKGGLTCIELKTGKVMWMENKARKGSIAYADGHFYYRDEGSRAGDGGDIILVEANPKQYVEKGRFKQPDRQKANSWSHPVIANGKLYIRDQDVLLCYDVKAK